MPGTLQQIYCIVIFIFLNIELPEVIYDKIVPSRWQQWIMKKKHPAAAGTALPLRNVQIKLYLCSQ